MNHDVMPFDFADPKFKAKIDKMIRDVLIILVDKAGGEIRLPVSEIDTKPKGLVLTLAVEMDGPVPVMAFKIGRTQ